MRSAWVDIDLVAVADNVRFLLAKAAPAAGMAVVKANAYGHGSVQVARTALDAGASWLGVALVQEGAELRAAGIAEPVLVLGHPALEEMEEAIRLKLAFALSSHAQIAAAAAAARRCGQPAAVHLKVDTGMGRLGAPWQHAEGLMQTIRQSDALQLQGIFTHLATADDPHEDFAATQLQRFASLAQSAGPGVLRHALNSAGVLRFGSVGLDLVRFGIAMYGLNPDGRSQPPAGLRPVLSLKAHISHLKTVPAQTPIGYGRTFHTDTEGIIATVPIGYADGYRRGLSNSGEVLIGGRRQRVVGRVSMDQITVLVQGVQAMTGDEVVLIGRQGEEEITVAEVAMRLDTINYEVVTGLTSRLPRRTT